MTVDMRFSLKRKLPKTTTLHPVILASDKTHLTNYSGDKSMHVVLLTIGNIPKPIRRKISRNAYILLAEIPSPKFENTQFSTAGEKNDMPGILRRQLFHLCMSIVLEPLRQCNGSPKLYRAVDPQGYHRKCAAVLAGWIADMDEVWLILGLSPSTCPKCLASHADLDSLCNQPARTSQWILDTLARVRNQVTEAADTWQFVSRAKEHGLFGVEKLCWEGIGVDVCRVICFDILHTLHKGFYDHLFSWIQKTVGEDDLDRGLMAQPHFIGRRNFSRGISHLSQLSGREHRDLQRHILPTILGHPSAIPRVQKAARAFLDFSYKVQFPLHSDHTLALLEEDLQAFYRNYTVFISNGTRELNHMKIPKLHYLRHASSNIKYLGALDGLSTETLETLHRLVKAAYPLTNRKRFKIQILRILQRTESVRLFSSYLDYASPAASLPNIPVNIHIDSDSDSDDDDNEIAQRSSGLDPVLASQEAEHSNGNTVQLGKRLLRGLSYKLSLRSHDTLSVDQLARIMPQADTVSPFIWFFTSGKRGDSHRTQHHVHRQHELPAHLGRLPTWFSFKLQAPAPNIYYQSEIQTVHCNPCPSDKPAVFDPVVIEMDLDQSGLKRTYLLFSS